MLSSQVVRSGVVALMGFGVAVAGAQTRPSPPAGAKVHRIQVVADKAPDCSSLASIAETVTRGANTNDAKAVAIYNFMLLCNYHRAYPEEPGGVPALKLFNTYGWALCGGLHTAQAALWRELGWKWRYLGWPGHTTVEAFYDGQWHYLDVFLKVYTWRPDPKAPQRRTIASQADIAANPDLILKDFVYDESRQVYYRADNPLVAADGQVHWMAPAFFVCTDEPKGVVEGANHRRDAGSPTAWAAIKFEEDGYSTDVNLGPGWALTLTWDKVPGAFYWAYRDDKTKTWREREEPPVHGCPPSTGDRDYRNCPALGPVLEPYVKSGGQQRSYANGTLVFAPDLANDAFLAGLADKQNVKVAGGQLVPAEAGKPASITVELASPYVMTRARGRADGGAHAEVSVDGGKTFKPIDLKDFSAAVRGRLAALVRLTFQKPVKNLELEAVVQCNRGGLPYLSPGPNKITVSAADPRELGPNRLVVTYAYHVGWRDKPYEEMVKARERIGLGLHATWSDKPTVVQKVFEAKDLPATFRIDVPTPKGKHQVYPRMVFLRREVLAPGQKPQPLPADAVEPKTGPDSQLLTLPNPFLMGTSVNG